MQPEQAMLANSRRLIRRVHKQVSGGAVANRAQALAMMDDLQTALDRLRAARDETRGRILEGRKGSQATAHYAKTQSLTAKRGKQ